MSEVKGQSDPRFWVRVLRLRSWVQLASTLTLNSGVTQQVTKAIPCLALNCYACPLAVTACPIGSIQHFVGLRQVPWYVLGVIGLAGALGGRLACGWFCPFGWLQELLHRLPVPKWHVRPRRRAGWRWLVPSTLLYAAGAYAVLQPLALTPFWFALYLTAGFVLYAFLGSSRLFALFGVVVLLPLVSLEPWFCKLCPAGMLEGGIPQVMLEPSLRDLVGSFFWLKAAVLLAFLAWMMATRRPFCRWICPLGTLWSYLNRWSTLQMSVRRDVCSQCNRCQQVCPVDIRIYEDANPGECIRCMECVEVCPVSCVDIKAH
ncbi:MAG: 4Fe-4S binding protein [Anaerolineae bacterium]|nr:4Fe-4S binding protein [Anaerolineae bacterium]